MVADIRKLMHAVPFVPFTIHLADGRKYEIDHPDFVSSHPQGRTAIVYLPGENGDFEIIDLLLVVGVEVHKSRQNGRRRKSA